MNIELVKIKSGDWSDGVGDDYHMIDIYADEVKVGDLSLIDKFNEDNDICYIERIDIDEEHRNQGIGSEVLQNALYQVFGYYSVVVAPDNEDAKRLYERIGEEDAFLDCEFDFGYLDQGYGVYVI